MTGPLQAALAAGDIDAARAMTDEFNRLVAALSGWGDGMVALRRPEVFKAGELPERYLTDEPNDSGNE